MRVVLIALHFAEYSAHLAKALADSNEVLLVLYGDNARNELGKRLEEEYRHPQLAILLVERPKGIFGVFRNFRILLKSVRQFRPDTIHVQEDLRDELMMALPFWRAYPLLMTIHDPTNHAGHDASALKYSRFRVYRSIVRNRLSGAFVHGTPLLKVLEVQRPHLSGKIISVPHGPLGPVVYPPVGSFPSRASFLFFGRIHEYKGLRYFVEAILKLRNEGLDVRGVIAGRGTDLQGNMALISSDPEGFDVIDRYIDEPKVNELFGSTTAAVLPYIEGTQSGVAALALGYGRPVVASRVGSIPELVRDRVNGLLVDPANTASLTEAMRALATDASLWRELAAGACVLRDGELSWREIAATTTKAYATLR